MRFKLYLVENEEKLEITDADINKIRKDCYPYISWQRNQKETKPLYRGRNKLPNAVNLKTRRKDRKPLNTRRVVSDLFDDMLMEKFGWRPRAEGVFTIGKYSYASLYGTPQLFFPVGKYRYVWNTKYDDLFLTPEMGKINKELLVKSADDPNDFTGNYDWKDEKSKDLARIEIQKLVDDCKDTGLYDAITTGNEVMFDCDRYYMVNDIQYNVSRYSRRNELDILHARIIHG